MKIAYIGVKRLPSNSGTERVVEAIVRRLAGVHHITVYCDRTCTPRNLVIPGVNLIRVPTLPGKYTRAPILYLLSAFHALFFGDYDLIHVNGVETCFVLPILKLRFKVLSTAHGSTVRIRRDKWGKIAQFILEKMEYPFCKYSDYATSVSLPDAKYFASRFGTKVAYIPNGVDRILEINQKTACEELAKNNIQPGRFLLFAAGRMDPSKGCHLVIEAYNTLHPDIPLLIIGDMNQVPAYSDSLRKMAAHQKIFFLQLITDRPLLYGIVKSARLFIFPSLREGMSMMLLEAASLGTPVICSDIEENREVMKDSAVYFKSANAGDLAQKLEWALEQPELVRQLADKAKLEVLETFSWDKAALDYKVLYEECAKGVPLKSPEFKR